MPQTEKMESFALQRRLFSNASFRALLFAEERQDLVFQHVRNSEYIPNGQSGSSAGCLIFCEGACPLLRLLMVLPVTARGALASAVGIRKAGHWA